MNIWLYLSTFEAFIGLCSVVVVAYLVSKKWKICEKRPMKLFVKEGKK